MPDFNDWDVPYSVINFFCQALGGHDRVESYDRTKDILFTIKLKDGRVIKALLVNDYAIGIASVLRARREFPEADYIVTGGNWNGYTKDAKDYGSNHSIGIFNVGEFFGALNWSEPKKYYKKDEKGNPFYHYKSA
jgi:hypothetical protein